MNRYVVTAEYVHTFQIASVAFGYNEAIKKMNELKKQFPDRDYSTRIAMPQYYIGATYPKA